MFFAYRKGGILHCVNSEAEAKEFADGVIKTYRGRAAGGYPTIGGRHIIDKKEGTFIGSNGPDPDVPLAKCDKIVRDEVKLILAEIGL